jgi:hypothetical protein
MGEVGKMLIKIGKRGRKHGLGIVGISQRPADVKKDYITQCDWLVWHRLTWNNDTKVVGRILDSKYENAVEDLNDGEAFMMSDWSERVRRVQFHRKQTFDAGATPGLDDFERPELKSVSDDLVSELETISEEKQATESRIKELREELDKKNSRIAELETELQDARDLSRMAEQFTSALLDHVDDYNPGKTEQERMEERRQRFDESDDDAPTEAAEPDAEDRTSGGGFGDAFSAFADAGPAMNGGADDAVSTNGSEPVANGSSGGVVADDGDAEEAFAAAMAGAPDEPEVSTNGHAGSDDDGILDAGEEATVESRPRQTEPAVVSAITTDIVEMEEKTRRMLSYYKDQGPGTPLNAHFSSGGSGDRTAAYARNRTLRLRGLIEHVGRGSYDYRLRELIAEESERDLDDMRIEDYASRIEADVIDGT